MNTWIALLPAASKTTSIRFWIDHSTNSMSLVEHVHDSRASWIDFRWYTSIAARRNHESFWISTIVLSPTDFHRLLPEHYSQSRQDKTSEMRMDRVLAYLTLHNASQCCDFIQFREFIVAARSTNHILQRTNKTAVFSGIRDPVFEKFDHRSKFEKKAHFVA